MRRRYRMYVMSAAFCLLLSACAGIPRSETIIMNDDNPPNAEEETASLAVKTIYTVLDAEQGFLFPLGWLDDSSLLGMTSDYPSGIRLDRVNEPYAARQKLYDIYDQGTYSSIVLLPDRRFVSYVDPGIVLSPDRRFVSYIDWRNSPELHLLSLGEGDNIGIEMTRSKNIVFSQMSWSNNSRYFSYADADENDGRSFLFVYDTTEQQKQRYTLPSWQTNELISFVSVSDNGADAVVVKTTGRDSVLEWGKLDGEQFKNQYRHPVSANGPVEWIHPDQIAFVGADGTLYAYDQRNRLLSTLQNEVGRFRLSGDRKLIAYTQGDTVYAASIYGNTLLNRQQIYKGIDAYSMQWSPDNGKLLLTGLKPSSPQRTGELFSAPAPAVAQSIVIEFK